MHQSSSIDALKRAICWYSRFYGHKWWCKLCILSLFLMKVFVVTCLNHSSCKQRGDNVPFLRSQQPLLCFLDCFSLPCRSDNEILISTEQLSDCGKWRHQHPPKIQLGKSFRRSIFWLVLLSPAVIFFLFWSWCVMVFIISSYCGFIFCFKCELTGSHHLRLNDVSAVEYYSEITFDLCYIYSCRHIRLFNKCPVTRMLGYWPPDTIEVPLIFIERGVSINYLCLHKSFIIYGRLSSLCDRRNPEDKRLSHTRNTSNNVINLPKLLFHQEK